MILDEAKTMIEIGAYHNHIVNLQGVTYSLNLEEKRFLDVSNDTDNYLESINIEITLWNSHFNINLFGTIL